MPRFTEAVPLPAPPPAVEFREVVMEPVATTFEFVARTRAREDAQVRAQPVDQKQDMDKEQNVVGRHSRDLAR